MAPIRFEAEQRANEQQRSGGRPGLGTTGGGILDGVFGLSAIVARKGFWQAIVKQAGGFQNAQRDARCFLSVSILLEAPGDQRVVMRPDCPHVIADRVVGAFTFGHGPHTPTREELFAHQVRNDTVGSFRLDDAAPQKVTDVGSERVDLALAPIETEREKSALGQPEILVEAALELRCLALQLLCPGGVVPDLASEPSRAAL